MFGKKEEPSAPEVAATSSGPRYEYKVQQLTPMMITPTLNKLGEQGWRMVATATMSSGVQAYFIRELR